MARVHEQRRNGRRKERRAAGQKVDGHILHRPGVDKKTHGERPAETVAARAQQYAEARAENEIPGHDRYRCARGLSPLLQGCHRVFPSFSVCYQNTTVSPRRATAKREKSRRRFTLCCGRLPEKGESAPESAAKAYQKTPSAEGVFEEKKGAPKGAPPPQCRRGQIRTCTTRQVGHRPTASALPTSGIKPGGLQFTAGERHPLYLMWV